MQSRTRTTVYAGLSILIACVTISTCQAADRFSRSGDTGQPRELINQPVCCAVENADALRRCEIGEQP